MEISGLGFHQEILASGTLPDPQKVSGRMIEKLDKDGDGLLQVNELEGRFADRLKGADADEDGLLSQEELIQQFESKMAEFGGFEVGKRPDIHRLKSMIGQQSFANGLSSDGEQPDLFSILDSLEASEEEKADLKEAINNAPFDVFG